MKQKKWVVLGAVLILMSAVLLKVAFPKQNDIIYKFDDKEVTATEYYESLKQYYTTPYIYQMIQKEYLSTLELDASYQTSIETDYNNILAQYSTEESKNMLSLTLKSYGYKGIEDLKLYLENNQKLDNLLMNQLFNYFNDYESLERELKPRIVTHVLVYAQRTETDHAAASSPTSEEKEAMDAVDKALKESTNPKLTMLQLSDEDTTIGQSLGYVDKNSSLVLEFLAEALKLSESDISGWVKTSYGYHRILIESTQKEAITKEPSFLSVALQYDSSLESKIVLDAMLQDGVVIDETLLKEMKAYYELEGDQA